jgi:hypothetical protein
MRKRIFAIISIFLAMSAVSSVVYSQALLTDSQKTGMPFLRVVPTARIAGMGGAGVSLPSGASSSWLNPALLALVDERCFQFTHTELVAGIRQEYAAVSSNTGLGHLGASVQIYDSGDFDAYGNDASPAGTTSIKYASFSFSYAVWMGNFLALGVSYKRLLEKVAQDDAGGYAFDFGATCRTPIEGLFLSAALRNYGRMEVLKNVRTKLPTDGGFGFLYRSTLLRYGQPFSAVCDYVAPRYGKKGARLGVEIDPVEHFHLRAGYRGDSDTEDVSFGVGLDAGIFTADVAYTPMQKLDGNAVRFGLSITGI